ncbi:MAG TPA: hypothetical protein VHE59_10445 [Mucilaginibacter sp.]|nr:hypothetical protein [Mucilaginibacter sp.]
MKLSLLLFSILFANGILAQNNDEIQLHGSLITIELGTDGIVVCADSRAMIMKDGRPYAYFDSVAKITQVRGIIFGTTGVANLGHRNLLNLARQIENKIDWNHATLSFIINYVRAIKAMFSVEEIELLKENDFVVASYINNKPAIYEFTLQDLMDNSQIHPMRTYYVTAAPAVKYLKYDSTATCKKLAKLAERAIYKYSKEFLVDYSVGGPISVVQIMPNGQVNWIKNRFDTLGRTDWIQLQASGKILLKFVDPEKLKLSDSLIRQYKREHPRS